LEVPWSHSTSELRRPALILYQANTHIAVITRIVTTAPLTTPATGNADVALLEPLVFVAVDVVVGTVSVGDDDADADTKGSDVAVDEAVVGVAATVTLY
jgi:hypothetical protein